jgi:hypothetical protein
VSYCDTKPGPASSWSPPFSPRLATPGGAQGYDLGWRSSCPCRPLPFGPCCVAPSTDDGSRSWVRLGSSRQESFTKKARSIVACLGLLVDLLYYPLVVRCRVMGPVLPLAVFGVARSVRQQGSRFVLVIASCLGFVTLTWLLRSSLGLDRHFVVVIPLYAIFAAQGAAAIADATAGFLARRRRSSKDADRSAAVGRAVGGVLSVASLAALLVVLTVWMGNWYAALERGFPEREAMGKYLRTLPGSLHHLSATTRRSRSSVASIAIASIGTGSTTLTRGISSPKLRASAASLTWRPGAASSSATSMLGHADVPGGRRSVATPATGVGVMRVGPGALGARAVVSSPGHRARPCSRSDRQGTSTNKTASSAFSTKSRLLASTSKQLR